MAEYITREAAIKIAEKYGTGNGCVLGRHSGVADCVASEIAAIPAADVVAVVRCRDCTHYREYMGRDMCAKNATVLDGHEVGLRATGKDEFCSKGERSEE